MEGYNLYSEEKVNSSSFKSRGEEQIARLFDRSSIAYRYEHPAAVVDRGKTRIWYPDFYLPEYGMIVEYFGVNGNRAYDDQARHKMEVYNANGLDGLFLTEASFKGDWPTRIIGQIECVLRDRLDRFYQRQQRNI
ncbi:MAG: hypothetical protein H8D47_02125 [Planctomycetes bacterium]|nr:hypothetical protein [Planctomycetota bacterium]